jgi:hypothetical protein
MRQRHQRDAVALIALKFRWSRTEILALPPDEFKYYVELLTRDRSDH